MKFVSCIIVSLMITSSVVAQSEKVSFTKQHPYCEFCKRSYEYPIFIPDIFTIKNDTIKSKILPLALAVGNIVTSTTSDIQNSDCNSALSRNGKHEWRWSKEKSEKRFYTISIGADGDIMCTKYLKDMQEDLKSFMTFK